MTCGLAKGLLGGLHPCRLLAERLHLLLSHRWLADHLLLLLPSLARQREDLDHHEDGILPLGLGCWGCNSYGRGPLDITGWGWDAPEMDVGPNDDP